MAVFRAHGEVHLMRECKWKRQLQTMEKPTTQMGRILHEDNQETLYQAILDETVFGFIKCDVETPREMIESFGEFLFPPLFCRMQVTSDLVRALKNGKILGIQFWFLQFFLPND